MSCCGTHRRIGLASVGTNVAEFSWLDGADGGTGVFSAWGDGEPNGASDYCGVLGGRTLWGSRYNRDVIA